MGRLQVPRLFEDVVEACKGLASNPSEYAAAVALWLRCVPLEGEIRDFFMPSVGDLHRVLGSMQCLPTEAGGWVQPRHALLATSESMQELLLSSGLLHEAGLSMVHPDLKEFTPALKVTLQTRITPAARVQMLLVAWASSTRSEIIWCLDF